MCGNRLVRMQTGWIQASRRINRWLAWDPTRVPLGLSFGFPFKIKQNFNSSLKQTQCSSIFKKNTQSANILHPDEAPTVLPNIRYARFAGQAIPRCTEHQTMLPEPNRGSDRCGRTLDWVSEASFGVLTGICRMACLNYCGKSRDYFGVPRDIPTLLIERVYWVKFFY